MSTKSIAELKKKQLTDGLKVLKKMRSLIQKGWTKGAYARDKRNKDVAPTSKSARKWCIMGAYTKAYSLANTYVPYETVLGKLDKAMTKRRTRHLVLAQYNDAQKNKKPIINLIDKSIDSLKKEIKAYEL